MFQKFVLLKLGKNKKFNNEFKIKINVSELCYINKTDKSRKYCNCRKGKVNMDLQNIYGWCLI